MTLDPSKAEEAIEVEQSDRNEGVTMAALKPGTNADQRAGFFVCIQSDGKPRALAHLVHGLRWVTRHEPAMHPHVWPPSDARYKLGAP